MSAQGSLLLNTYNCICICQLVEYQHDNERTRLADKVRKSIFRQLNFDPEEFLSLLSAGVFRFPVSSSRRWAIVRCVTLVQGRLLFLPWQD